jgi:hypothetical protein
MDGQTDLETLARHFEEKFQSPIPQETLQSIILQLDEAHCLETMGIERVRQERLRAYREAPAREMFHAESGYPAEADDLRAMLDGQFTMEGGPGRAPRGGENASLSAIVSPHIDFRRGGPNYGWAYGALGEGPEPETVVIFGTAHAPCRSPMLFTGKDFETPLGAVRIDQDFVDAVQAKVDHDLFEDELVHVAEHSIEFQAICLRHVFPNSDKLRIVPILCGVMDGAPQSGSLPPGGPFAKTLQAVIDTISSWPRRVTVIAGADLAHIGPQFGHEREVDEGFLNEVRAEDEEALRFAAAGDAEGFLGSFAASRNARNVCSVAAIYATLRCLPALGVERGRLLNYVQSADPSGALAVTHAAMAFP